MFSGVPLFWGLMVLIHGGAPLAAAATLLLLAGVGLLLAWRLGRAARRRSHAEDASHDAKP